MNRRELFTSSAALAVGALIPGTDVSHGQDLSIKGPTAGAKKIYTECYPLDDESPIHSVRITVTLKDTDEPISFWHPLDSAKAARWVADQEEAAYKSSSRVFGPHDDSKFTFKS